MDKAKQYIHEHKIKPGAAIHASATWPPTWVNDPKMANFPSAQIISIKSIIGWWKNKDIDIIDQLQQPAENATAAYDDAYTEEELEVARQNNIIMVSNVYVHSS